MKPDDDTMAALEALLTRPDPPAGAPSPWTLERYVAGDLPDAEARAVREALTPEQEAQVAALRRDEEAFEAARPWSDVRAGILARAERVDPAPEVVTLSRRKWWHAGWLSLAGAAAVLTVVFLLPPEPTSSPNRYKSADTLQAFQLVEGRAERVEAGEALGAGDRIQFKASTPHGYLALIGVDGTGTVSRYQPVGGETSVEFAPGNGVPLPDALELDDAPGPEVFFAVFSDEPLLVEDLERAVHDVVQDDVRAALRHDWSALGPQVSVFHVEKRR